MDETGSSLQERERYELQENCPVHGRVRFTLGERPALLSVDDSLLRVMGVSEADLELRHDDMALLLELQYMDSVAHFARRELQAMEASGHTQSGFKRYLVTALNGSMLRVSANLTLVSQGDPAAFVPEGGNPQSEDGERAATGDGSLSVGAPVGSLAADAPVGSLASDVPASSLAADAPVECELFVVVDKAPAKGGESFGNVMAYASETADLVFQVDPFRKCAVCTKNNFASVLNIPMNLPLLATDAFNVWIDEYVEAGIRAELREFCNFNRKIVDLSTRHVRFTLKKDRSDFDFSCLMLSEGGQMVAILKALNGQGASSVEELAGQPKKAFIRTFGSFDVFVDGSPVVFHSSKAKEYLALLVDRRGGFVTSRDAVEHLWEESAVGEVELARARKAAMNLRKTLEQYGIDDIIQSSGSSRRLDIHKVECDLYEYLKDPEESKQVFRGSYMSQYSWSEQTLAELTFSFRGKPSESRR